jgi:hypothetical protein
MAKRLSPFLLSETNFDGRSDGAAFARGLFAASSAARASAGPPGPPALLAPFSGPILTSSLNGVDGFRIEGASAENEAGTVVSGLGDINGDGIDDFAIGVPLEDVGAADAGATYVIFGNASGLSNFSLDTLGSGVGFRITGAAAGDRAGYIAGAGDVNNDGIDDFIVGAPMVDNGATADTGAAYLIFGRNTGFSNIDLGTLAASDGFKISGAATRFVGLGIASAGDVNNDGFADLVIGSPHPSAASRAYVVFGKATGFGPIDLGSLGSNGFVINAERNGDQLGYSVSSAGDVNNDGFDDLIIGAPGHDGNGTDSGAAYVIFGKASGFGTINLATLAAADGYKIVGEPTPGIPGFYDSAGFSVSAAGDVNNDGYDDVIIGAYRNDQGGGDAGAAYVIFGKASGFSTLSLANFTIADGFKIIGERPPLSGVEYTGFSVSGAGDVNGDGYADILVGAPNNDLGIEAGSGPQDHGAVYLIFGRAGGFRDVDMRQALVPADGIRINGDDGFLTGSSVSAAGDVNDDGYDDLIIGSPMHDSTLNDVGAAYVIYGRAGFGGTQILGTPGNDDPLFGTGGMDDIRGLGGNDYLEGFGGGDRMEGGPGNDILVVDETSDVAFEAIGEGSDTLYTSVSYALNRGAEIEILAARDNQSTGALTLTGNAFANAILGNNGSNSIDGGGGGDVMVGYGGDDTYTRRSLIDQVYEAVGGGTDIVYTDFDFTIGTGQEIETVSALSPSSTAALNLYGNELANTLLGNNGVNILMGGGGNDTLRGFDAQNGVGSVGDFLDGGTGADIVQVGFGRHVIVVDDLGDVVTGTGRDDVIYATASYTLGAGNAVGGLLAIDNQATVAMTLTGNELTNVILGNNGANVLDGKGGNDFLEAYGGADSFAFTTALGAGNFDVVGGFNATDDTILLDDAIFTGLTAGALPAGAFVTGTAAADADDRILYDSATGNLFFDADGNGAGAAILFARLEGAPVITASDFLVI